MWQNTPLHEAVKQCNLSTSKVLMHEEWRLGHIVNEHGESAVYLAAERGELEIVRMLLQFSARAVGGPDHQTALHAAVCRNSGSQFSPQCMDLMTKDFYSEDAEEINRYRALSNNLAIVAVLIATVTFAAAFTLPGGYENDGPDRGMAILGKKTTFKAFLISDALAMVSSIIVTCFLIYTGSSDHDVRLHSIRVAMKLMWVAHGGMVVAFATGIYVVVESGRKCISVLICSMACSVPSIAWMMAHCPAFDSLNLVTTRRNQDKKGKETPLL
ncbi:uncharacterized protein A4U43_C03F10910 [Asparagus officinalis]|uniref:PGG domain-containing protein n=1 Tax=Asparagus officinalis TaxID=4686 RepID=A0A5P1F9T8_ASPOF|nr:uncharacterized protein A4U43_C03F10910 [Asparagus officinalis]